jgi:hypothetical protein
MRMAWIRGPVAAKDDHLAAREDERAAKANG